MINLRSHFTENKVCFCEKVQKVDAV